MNSKNRTRLIFALAVIVGQIGYIVSTTVKAQRELEEAERTVAIRAEIATRTQAAHLDLELARVGMRVAKGELTPAQGDELRAVLHREYGGE